MKAETILRCLVYMYLFIKGEYDDEEFISLLRSDTKYVISPLFKFGDADLLWSLDEIEEALNGSKLARYTIKENFKNVTINDNELIIIEGK